MITALQTVVHLKNFLHKTDSLHTDDKILNKKVTAKLKITKIKQR